jgi:hypothetical protein
MSWTAPAFPSYEHSHELCTCVSDAKMSKERLPIIMSKEPRLAKASACVKHRRPTTMRSGAGRRTRKPFPRLYENVQQGEQ